MEPVLSTSTRLYSKTFSRAREGLRDGFTLLAAEFLCLKLFRALEHALLLVGWSLVGIAISGGLAPDAGAFPEGGCERNALSASLTRAS